MPPAARINDPTDHPGIISGPGVPTVLIGKKPAAVVGNLHQCLLPPTAGPHPQSAIVQGSATVFIGKRQAARVGDKAGCSATITKGALNVLIGG